MCVGKGLVFQWVCLSLVRTICLDCKLSQFTLYHYNSVYIWIYISTALNAITADADETLYKAEKWWRTETLQDNT